MRATSLSNLQVAIAPPTAFIYVYETHLFTALAQIYVKFEP
ncbi:hypothetical protein [Campylobacter massiliensis]|nr:hypothetical protein [Campylobacter massiliensis]